MAQPQMKSMIDILAEALVMAAAMPGQNLAEQRRTRLNKQILMPIVETLQAQDQDAAMDAMESTARAMSLFMMASPDYMGEALVAMAKKQVEAWKVLVVEKGGVL